ncbi:hypothetical protein POM88_038838 [Heracleum sosnowskyi]|uniref:Serine-threonine/tyrosine-protein kinase catalytic domain-containing protein n=1 Tax=Heracleum sosnowskyi TaxID=360622 RepID=A0AAD8H8T3_9APIA|nr:hypothetical protein POM88_038838 [Heracleum sosnowskyi]
MQLRNLVKLYGCCIEGDKRLLVYEYLENNSLDQALFGKTNLFLDWSARYDICLGVARVKCSTGERMACRLLLKLRASFRQEVAVWHQLDHPKVTRVLYGKPYKRKCDVYSFGVCLWEIYCCDLPYVNLSFAEVSSIVVRQVSLT